MINGVQNNSPVQKVIQNPIQKEVTAPTAPATTSAHGLDKLELSGMSHLLDALKTNDVRVDKVAQVKSQIEAGTYETEDKLDAAADKLLDVLLK